MESGLKQKAIAGTIWSAMQRFGISFLMFISNIVLARLLTPDDYGCIGMLAIFITIANALVSGGFASALIQKKEANDIDYSTVFIWNLVVSVLLYVLLFITAPLIAEFYGIYKLTDVLRVQGVVLLINGCSVIQTTILRRELKFRKLAILNIISSTLSVIIAIIFAYLGFGVWALVIQQLSLGFFNGVLLWFSTSWHPTFSFSYQSFKTMFSYGSFLLLNDLINNLCDNIQGLLIGKQFSSSTMGFYTQAKRLEEVPTQSISQVVAQVTFPIYSKIQGEKVRMYKAVKNSLSLMNYINFPLMMLLICVSNPLIIFLFSDKWINSIPYFQILCVAGIVNCMQSVNYQVVSATGRSKQLFYWNFVKRGVGIIFMLIGIYFGIEGLLWGMVASFYLIYIINAVLAYPLTGYSIKSQIVDNIPIFFLALVSFFIAYLFRSVSEYPLLQLLTQTIIYVSTYIVLSLIMKREELKEVIYVVKSTRQ